MFSRITINSSSKSSTSSATKVTDILTKWGNNPISSCVLGISKIGKASNLSTKFTHAALLMLEEKFNFNDDESDILKRNGILVEYGDYSPDMEETEKKYTENGYVIYQYGEKGGLRYYGKNYGEFIEEFGDIGHIELKINEVNLNTFEYFINKIAKKEDNKWIKANYKVGFYNFNCQTFVIEALKEIKPNFNLGDVYPKDKNLINKRKQSLNFIPDNIKNQLMKYLTN